MVVLSVLLLLTLPYLFDILKIIFFKGNVFSQLEMYKWAFVGIILYYFIRKYVMKNVLFYETWSHEHTHLLTAWFFNRRIHSIHIENTGSGVIFTSGNNNYTLIPVALAPYCLPILTYALLIFRFLLKFRGMWIYDILIGMTLCFHYYCFKTQTRSYQTDINQYPLTMSYYYIFVFWIINTCIILTSFFPNMNGYGKYEPKGDLGLISCLWRLVCEWWDNLSFFANLIF